MSRPRARGAPEQDAPSAASADPGEHRLLVYDPVGRSGWGRLRRPGWTSAHVLAPAELPPGHAPSAPVHRPSREEASRLAAYSWTDRVVRALVDRHGGQLFPAHQGVSLAGLNRLELQVYMLSHARLAATLASLLAGGRYTKCLVAVRDAARRASLAELATGAGADVTDPYDPVGRLASVVPAMARRVRTDGRRAPSAEDWSSRIGARPGGGALLVSESLPMAQMFAPVEEELGGRGAGPLLRVQFRSGRDRVVEGAERTVLEVAGGLEAPPRTRGRFQARWREVRGGMDALSIRESLGEEMLRAPLTVILRHIYDELLDLQAEHLDRVARLLDRVRPDLVVVGNDRWWFGAGFVEVARSRGIGTLCLQDGLTGDNPFWWWITADTFAAAGDEMRRVMVRRGVDPERVVVTGQPRYDRLASIRAARTRHHREDRRPRVVVATQPHHTTAFAGRVAEAARAAGSVDVVIRPHPSEPSAKYDALSSPARPEVTIDRGSDLFALLADSDVVVTEYSTVGVEAAGLGLPVIAVEPGGSERPASLSELGVALPAHDCGAITEGVRACLRGDGARGDAAGMLGPLDGGSAGRVADLIAAGIDRGPRSSAASPGRREPQPVGAT